MAKKRQKTTRFSIQSYDAAHYRQTEQYTQAVDALFDRATTEIARAAAKGTYDPDSPFSFDDYPSVKSVMQKVTAQLATRMVTVIETGSKKQWLFACDKNDGFIESIMDTSKLSKARLKKMQDRNLEALQTFQKRKVEGMNLSQRVWKYVGQYQAQLESALDVGLGEGRSAAQLSRDVRENLKEPNRLFRRVRDKRGNLVLSKAARAFHPGQGVYRSSYKNAMRLTRSEINMAYRESDFLRWQSLDFVVGFEIRRSNHEPLCKCDLCAKLVGRYPKTFKFKGWHPQCMCFAVPILMDEETFDENELGDLKAALNGTQYKKLEAKNLVTDVPDGFKQWAKDHEEAQKNWSSTPYFIKDNFKNGKLSEGLKIDLPTLSKAEVVQAIVRFEAKTPQEAIDYIINNVADGCTLKITPKDLPLVNQIINQVVERMQQFGIPKFKNIGVCASRKAQASWTDDNELNFNLSQLKPEKIWSLNEAWAKRGVKWSHYESIEDTIRATIDHEIGHRLYMQYSMGNATREAFAKAAVTRNGFNEMNEVLGYYASTEEQEYFAEAFARWMGKGRSGVVGYTKALMEELMAKVAPKQADVLAPYRTQIAQARQQATKWGLSVQLTMLEKYVAEKNIASIQSRIATIQQKANEMAMADADIRRKCAEWGLSTFILDEAMLKPDSKNILAKISELENRVRDAEKEYKAFISDATNAINEARKYKVDISEMLADVATITGDKREWIMCKASYKKALQDFLDKIRTAKAASGGDTPHKAIRTSYTVNSELDDTFKVINSEFTTERWFEHGDMKIKITYDAGCNGSTNMRGEINLRPERLALVKTAMAKIGQGKSADITFEEADAMATFWHEITHNRNVPGNCWRTDTQTDVMEMMNEFVARKTLPEFYAKLGCAKTPHPEFINNRDSTGYNRRVLGYDFVIQKLGLDATKVLQSARKNLFALKYTDQETTAIQALLDGGLDKFKRVDGKPIGKAQLKKIVAFCRKGVSTTTLENYLKNEKIIPEN